MNVPEGWKNVVLGDLMEFKNGLNTDKENYGCGIKFVNVMDVFRNNRLYESNVIGSVQVNDKQLSEYSVKHGDVLFNRTSETFDEIAMSSVYLDSKPITFGGFVIRGRPKDNTTFPEYFVFCLQAWQIRKELIRRGQGAVRANIGQKDLQKVPLLMPPFPEQKKLARILSTWDRAIEVTEKLLNNSQQQKKVLMQQLLTGKKRLPGFSGEWEDAPIKSMGKIVSGGTPDTNINEYWDGNVLWMTPTDVTALKNRYISNTKRKITQLGVKNSSATLMPKGSLLVCTRATIGLMSISTTEITTNQGFKNVVPNNRYDVDFLYYLFNFFKNKFVSYACGSTFLELSKKDFEKLRFSCPPTDEQQKIASVLSAADKEIEVLEQKLGCLRQEKKALMQQLLTGKRRVVP